MFSPYGVPKGLLTPDEESQIKNNTLLQLGLGLLSQSGPSLTPTSLGQSFGKAGMQAMAGQTDAIQGLLQNKAYKQQQDDVAENKKREEMFRGLVGSPASGMTPNGSPSAGTGLIGAMDRGDPNAMRNFYSNVAGLGGEYTKMGLGGLMPKPGEGYTLSPGQVRFDGSGRQVASVDANVDPTNERNARNDARNGENSLRDEFNKGAKDFITVRDSYGRLQAAAQKPSAAGDLALIFNYMKMLDPGSTVREGEFANAQNAAGVPQQIAAYYNRIRSGERLTDATRADFLNQAQGQYQSQENNHLQFVNQYTELAKRQGLNPKNVIVDYLMKKRPLGPPIDPKINTPVGDIKFLGFE
jgi:hypothetical protein